MMSRPKATLRVERDMLRSCDVVLCFDEVGRGAGAGPVGVGMVALDKNIVRVPRGLADSKLLSVGQRRQAAEEVYRWAVTWSVGYASAKEIDTYGIMRALRLAGERAIEGVAFEQAGILIDGPYDWMSRPERVAGAPTVLEPILTRTVVKADQLCGGVAGASVVAKVARDTIMDKLSLEYPEYGWNSNKGYLSKGHRDAIAAHGYSPEHRRSWKLLKP